MTVVQLIEELKEIEPLDFTYDKFGERFETEAFKVVDRIIERLPNVWKDDCFNLEIATNCDEILFRYRTVCERVADLLDEHVFGETECHTGYYDPVEDERCGCVDANTGWYYIDFD